MTDHHDEETPLLLGKSQTTPLPRRQLSLVFLALFAEPIASAYIFPFINQLIGELGITGGDDRKIGYYAGLIESLFFATQALTTWKWSRLSDFIGRRPVVLVGLLGLSMSNLAFGLSRTFPMLIISRCIAGLLNGNIGVMKSMVGEITDDTNIAQVVGIIPAIFMAGFSIAPLFGGALVKPQEKWPHIFRGEFWATYPYFLPSLISGSLTLFIFLVCATFMKESLPSKRGGVFRPGTPTADNSPENEKPIPMSTLLRTPSVMIPIANYGTLALVEIGFYALLPLFYSSPVEIGGLGFSPSIIGAFLAIYGIVNGAVQALLTSKIIERFGAKKAFSWTVLSFYPLILIFPIMSTVATVQDKHGYIIWILLVLQLLFMIVADMSYSIIFIFITRAAPNKQSLGSTNGLSQSLTSIARAIGPALTTASFAASKEYNVLGGNLIYVILALLTTFLIILSRRLPELKEVDRSGPRSTGSCDTR
ncbi:MFS general substrate transporter [Chiua virens]|nr:MFS general substrate transporter [Chiua virens]